MTDAAVYVAAFVLAVTATYVLAPLFRPPQLLPEPGGEAAAERLGQIARRKSMVYQSLRDAELDRQTGKLSEEDYEEMSRGLKTEALALLREEDAVRDGRPSR